MASRSLPIPIPQAQKRSLSRTSIHAPTLMTALIAFVAVLILFRWLHLILALQITSTGRQIQVKTQELGQSERGNSVVQLSIAEAESPQVQAVRASQLGYAPHAPIYLLLDQPLGQASDGAEVGPSALRESASGASVSSTRRAGLDSAFSTWLEATPQP